MKCKKCKIDEARPDGLCKRCNKLLDKLIKKDDKELKKQGGVSDVELLDEIQRMLNDGELEEKQGKYRLTKKGYDKALKEI